MIGSRFLSHQSWKIRLNALPPLVVFFYRNLLSISQESISYLMDLLLDCLADENVEVREMASKMFSGVVRCSQRQSIIPLKVRGRANGPLFDLTHFHRTGLLNWRDGRRCLPDVILDTRKPCANCTLRSWGCVASLRRIRIQLSHGCRL